MSETQIAALLHKDHMATVETLQSVEEFLGRNRKTPAVDDVTRLFLKRVARSLKAEVESHFGFEEGHLFPVFVEQGETGIVMMLTSEHASILPLALQVADIATAALESGFTDESWGDFRDAAGELVEREIFHIQKEEMGLLAAISALVDEETDSRLAEIYRATVG
jgi:hemerythrin-like domain-containing protein